MNTKQLTLIILITSTITWSCSRELPNREPYAKQIDSLIRIMTLEEKIGQMNLLTSDWDVTGPTMNENYKELIKAGKVGAVFNAFTVDHVRNLQEMAVEESRLGIPLLFGYDVIHGHRTIFPIPLGQAASWDLEAIYKSERIAATEATAEGINWTFAPMIDVSRDPRWGRVAESSGEDTWLAGVIGSTRVRGIQGNNLKNNNTLLACAKHFAAYGAPQAGRDYHTVDMSTRSLLEWYLPPFKACVDEHVGSIMTAFNEVSGIPATSNEWLLSDLLRDKWGFNGFVVTDYTSINELVPHGVATGLKEAARLALEAGVNMDMQGGGYLEFLPALVEEGIINETIIDERVSEILEAKYKLGLFEDPYRYLDKKKEKVLIMQPGHISFAREFVAKSCVLLKNENNTLPIPSGVQSIGLIGPLADSKIDMLGNWYAAGQADKVITLKEGLENKFGSKVSVNYTKGCETTGNDSSGFAEARAVARESDYIILALGENGWMSGEAASRTELDLPGLQLELAKEIIKLKKPTAAVLFNGRPLAIAGLDEIAPAILETWFGGTQAGNGIADVLNGDYNPSGKLTMTFPRNVGQIPIHYNMKNTGRPFNPEFPDDKYKSRYLDVPNTPLYPFGYGLSYTSFSYSDIYMSQKTYNENDTIKAWLNIKNTGKYDGEEVVQLYVRDLTAEITRPLLELKGFKKIMVAAGETKKVEFHLVPADLAYYHQDLTFKWDPGDFELHVGTSAADTKSVNFTISKN